MEKSDQSRNRFRLSYWQWVAQRWTVPGMVKRKSETGKPHSLPENEVSLILHGMLRPPVDLKDILLSNKTLYYKTIFLYKYSNRNVKNKRKCGGLPLGPLWTCETAICKKRTAKPEKGDRQSTKDEGWKSLVQRRRLRRMPLYHFINSSTLSDLSTLVFIVLTGWYCIINKCLILQTAGGQEWSILPKVPNPPKSEADKNFGNAALCLFD